MSKKKIEMGGSYESNGRPARILAIDIKNTQIPVVAAVLSNGQELIMGFNEYGEYYGRGVSSEANLIPSFRDFKIDEPVMVKIEFNTNWVKRHFAGITVDGKPRVFMDGCTSWTSNLTIVPKECRKPTIEELSNFDM